MPSKKKRRSGFEVAVEKQLPKGTKYEPKRFPYLKSCDYVPDFELPNGIFIEAKGHFKSSDRTKHKLVRQQWPELDIRFVFMRDNKLNKKSTTTYSQWCDQHDFQYCIKVVPKKWLTQQK